MKTMKIIIPGILFLIFIAGCATIPPEAPELSTELGKRISALEEANITLLHKFFDMKRNEVDKFMQEEWLPEFSENILSSPKISTVWDTIVAENNLKDRAEFIKRVSLMTQERVNKKRLELIKPLDDIENMLEQKIRGEYTQARSINNSLTSFLSSASKVDENRKKYMELAGISDEKINSIIDKTDNAVSRLVQGTETITDKIEKGKEYLNELLNLKDLLTN